MATKKAAAKKAVLTPAAAKRAKAAERGKTKRVRQLTDDELEFCRHIQAGTKPGDAAKAMGWSAKQADNMLKRPRVAAFLEQSQDAFIVEMAKADAKDVQKKGPTKGAVLTRLEELMMMRPLGLSESITGQVAAAKLICEISAFMPKAGGVDDLLSGFSEDELDQISMYGLGPDGKPNGPATVQ